MIRGEKFKGITLTLRLISRMAPLRSLSEFDSLLNSNFLLSCFCFFPAYNIRCGKNTAANAAEAEEAGRVSTLGLLAYGPACLLA